MLSINTNLNKTKQKEPKQGSEYKYIAPLEFCPFLGPQAKQTEDTGFCVTWSTLYLHMRLINPDAPRSEVIEYLI